MRTLLPLLALTSLLLSAGCDQMLPGTVGWFCETNEDCDEGLRCVRYNHRGTDHENLLCTGDERLEDTNHNHGWISLFVSWTMCIIGPALLLLLIVVVKVRDAIQARRKPPQA